MTNPTLRELVIAGLKAGGFDGLHDDNACGCDLDNLFSCGTPGEGCCAGYRVEAEPGQGVDYWIMDEKPEEKD
jgi:hypothetical protein